MCSCRCFQLHNGGFLPCSKDVVQVSATVMQHNRFAKVIISKKMKRMGYKKKKKEGVRPSTCCINYVRKY